MKEARVLLIEKLEALLDHLKSLGPLDPSVFHHLGTEVLDAMVVPMDLTDMYK